MPFSRREIELLLGAVSTPLERAIVFLLLDTGLRRAELLSLNLAQLDFERGTLRVKGKGGEWRTEALNDAPKRAVLEYLSSRPQRDGLLWPEGFGIDQIRKLLDRLGDRAGVCRVHPHRFRHTFACNALRAGMDVLALKALLGHSSLQMVEYYVGMLESERALEEHRRHSLVG